MRIGKQKLEIGNEKQELEIENGTWGPYVSTCNESGIVGDGKRRRIENIAKYPTLIIIDLWNVSMECVCCHIAKMMKVITSYFMACTEAAPLNNSSPLIRAKK